MKNEKLQAAYPRMSFQVKNIERKSKKDRREIKRQAQRIQEACFSN